jgi:hypothetical protein
VESASSPMRQRAGPGAAGPRPTPARPRGPGGAGDRSLRRRPFFGPPDVTHPAPLAPFPPSLASRRLDPPLLTHPPNRSRTAGPGSGAAPGGGVARSAGPPACGPAPDAGGCRPAASSRGLTPADARGFRRRAKAGGRGRRARPGGVEWGPVGPSGWRWWPRPQVGGGAGRPGPDRPGEGEGLGGIHGRVPPRH